MYQFGRCESTDYREAAKWYQKSVDHGLIGAERILGDMYTNGQGVLQDYVQAHAWLNIASSDGDQEASKHLGELTKLMTPDQIAEAQRRAREWLAARDKE